jgi:hypothetical protein
MLKYIQKFKTLFLLMLQSIFVFLYIRNDPDPFHSGFVYSQSVAVSDGLLPNRNFLSPYGAIESLLIGKWLSSGEKVNQFERAFSKRFHSSHSVMVNSGSSANLVMIAALKDYFDWVDGDEVVVSVVGFPTTANSILQNGLVPRFVDIAWEDLNWDLQEVRNSINKKTKALFFHQY